MRLIRLLMIAIASFFGTIIGEGLVRRASALLMCGVLSFSSAACYAFFSNQANASIPEKTAKSITQVEKNVELSNLQTEINEVIAQIPRVRQQNQPTSNNEPSSNNNETVKPSRIPSQSQPRVTPENQLDQMDINTPTSATTSNKISLNRWWATVGDGDIPIVLNVSVPEAGIYFLTIDDKNFGRGWRIKDGTTVNVLNTKLTNRLGIGMLSVTDKLTSLKLSPGVNNIEIAGLSVPSQPAIDEISFQLSTPDLRTTIAYLNTLFVADQPPPIKSNGAAFSKQELEELAKKYAPILHFDTISAKDYPNEVGTIEKYQVPLNAKDTTWKQAEDKFRNNQLTTGDATSFISLPKGISYQKPAIYASIVQDKNNPINLAINYYFHYPYSDWLDHGQSFETRGFNNHEGDWESITVFLQSNGGNNLDTFKPKEVAFSQHVKTVGSNGGQKVQWQNLKPIGTRTPVWVGLGGHASYPESGCSDWSSGNEYHYGGVSVDKANVIYLPSAGTAISSGIWSLDEEWAWLLYPGTWGDPRKCTNELKGIIGCPSAPRGPIFLDTSTNSTGRGLRWLDPWKWAKGLSSEGKPKCKHESKPNEPITRKGDIAGAKSYGDPHIVTFDGYRYSFQTVGEFILAKSSDRVFEVQTRQSPVNRSLSLNSAVAMRVGNNRVAFYSKDLPDSDTSTPLRVNGKPTVIRDKTLSLPGGGSIQKQNDSNYVVQWATGEKVAVTIYSRGQFQYMDVFPFVFESQANQMVGLLGNVNGKENDDLRFRSGDILPSKSTYGNLNQLIQGVLPIRLPLGQLEKIYFDQLNKDFGNSWRVSTEESLFDYPAGKSSKTFTDKAFPDAYLTLDMLSPNQLQTARSQCLNAGVQASLLEGCVFDVGFTGYSEFAARTAQVSNILNLVESVIPGFKNPIPEIIRRLPKIPGLPF